MGELVNIDFIYKEIARAMLKELFEYLEGKDIKIIIDDTEIDVRFKKMGITEKKV